MVAISIFTAPKPEANIWAPGGSGVAGLSGLTSQGPAPWRTQLEWQGHSRGGTQLKLECRSGGYGIDVCEKGLKMLTHQSSLHSNLAHLSSWVGQVILWVGRVKRHHTHNLLPLTHGAQCY